MPNSLKSLLLCYPLGPITGIHKVQGVEMGLRERRGAGSRSVYRYNYKIRIRHMTVFYQEQKLWSFELKPDSGLILLLFFPSYV